MKVYYFSQVKPEDKGVFRKKIFQEKALLKNNIDLKVTKCKLKKLGIYEFYFENEFLGKENYRNKLDFFFRKLYQRNKIYSEVEKKCLKNKIEYIYIRYYRSDFFFIKFIKKLFRKKIKIILEIPTYPYDKEVSQKSLSLILDKFFRKKLKKYVHRIVTYSEDSKIWGISCINISNGIDLEEVNIVNRENRDINTIVFTSVSNCSFWHGIDRFLYSLEEYGKLKDEKKIRFNIVGEGSESNKLKKIVSKSKYLSKIVVFQGVKSGKNLDDIYDETDIGVGSLARHRSGLDTMRALKNREYCAKGLPMIFSEDDPDLRDAPFVYHISADEKLINIESVIKWYENISLKPEAIRRHSQQFSWDIQMKKVIDNIEKIDLERGV